MKKSVFWVCVFASTLALACSSPSHAAQFWLSDLGPLDGQFDIIGISSTATAFGSVSPYGQGPAAFQPLNQPLQVLSGWFGPSYWVAGVNASGVVTGSYSRSDVDTQKQWGFRLTPGSAYQPLKTPTGVAFSSISALVPWGINSGNRIVGRCSFNGTDRAFMNRIQVDFNLRKVETTTLLSTPAGYNSYALSIGEGNTVAGSFSITGSFGIAARWNPDGSWQVVAPSGSSGSAATCAAPNGRVAGVATYTDGWHLFRTDSAGVPQDLGSDGQSPKVRGINSSGAVVGTGNSLTVDYPLYISPGGNKYNLNTVYSTVSPISRILNAYSIDESGNILATALTFWGEKRVVRLIVINAE